MYVMYVCMYRGEMKQTVFLWRSPELQSRHFVFTLVVCNSIAQTVLYVI